MIGTSFRLIQTFAAVCTVCGSHGPEADGQPEAIALAKDEGWQHWVVIKESERLDIFRCLDCRLDPEEQ